MGEVKWQKHEDAIYAAILDVNKRSVTYTPRNKFHAEPEMRTQGSNFGGGK
jgi:hypothetical protein